MKRVILMIAAVLLTGCANLKFQWSASYMTDNLAADLRKATSPVEKQEVPPAKPTTGETK